MTSAPQHSFVRRIAGSVLRGKERISENIAEKLKRRHCVLGPDSGLLPSSGIDNLLRNPAAISIGSNARIAGHLLVFAHGGHLEIGNDFLLVKALAFGQPIQSRSAAVC